MISGKQRAVLYVLDKYRSHSRAGFDYLSLFESQESIGYFELEASIKNADLVILHAEPHDYTGLFALYPELRDKYVVSYCVWEATSIPEAYGKSISLVQEVWTPSEWNRLILSKVHPRVYVVPPLVRRSRLVSPFVMRRMRRSIDFQSHKFYFLSIGRVADRRKNIPFLIGAFEEATRDLPMCKLVVKADPRDNPSNLDASRVKVLRASLSYAEITALYKLSHIYISAHHSEAWGLTLSDAMVLGVPTIGTGYSGNDDFMTDSNSLRVRTTEEYIRDFDVYGLFQGHMKWGYPDRGDIVEKIRFACSPDNRHALQGLAKQARSDIARFNKTSLDRILVERLRILFALS